MILELLIDWLGGALVTVPLALIAIFLFDRTRAKRRWFWMVLLTMYLSAMYIIVGVPEFFHLESDGHGFERGHVRTLGLSAAGLF